MKKAKTDSTAAASLTIVPGTIKLTPTEARLILQASVAKKPVRWVSIRDLVELGIFEKVKLHTAEECKAKLVKAWSDCRGAVMEKNEEAASEALNRIREAGRDAEAYGHVLTEFGRKLAAGISVKLGAAA